jgi:hypothetical protein
MAYTEDHSTEGVAMTWDLNVRNGAGNVMVNVNIYLWKLHWEISIPVWPTGSTNI